MSESNARKRSLPSWMSSKDEKNDDGELPKQPRNHEKLKEDHDAGHGESGGKRKSASVGGSGSSDFSKLMDGVVFALSGFVHPERGILRSQMLEMGAEYQPDWNSNCTLLICAFPNTPKFKQVKAEAGTIISKDWVSECYNQRKLVDIEIYILHAGKPWKRQNILNRASEDMKPSSSSKSLRPEESSPSKKTTASPKMKACFSPSKVKKWAVEDLKRTISWLKDQDERPEPGEIKKVAAEGILTCLQDAIDSLKQGQDIQHIAEQWACIPRLVEELLKFDGKSVNVAPRSKEDLCREAMVCKQIYELEFLNMEHDEFVKHERPISTGSGNTGKRKKELAAKDDTSDDSDATIEMTEDEIDEAYNSIASSV